MTQFSVDKGQTFGKEARTKNDNQVDHRDYMMPASDFGQPTIPPKRKRPMTAKAAVAAPKPPKQTRLDKTRSRSARRKHEQMFAPA